MVEPLVVCTSFVVYSTVSWSPPYVPWSILSRKNTLEYLTVDYVSQSSQCNEKYHIQGSRQSTRCERNQNGISSAVGGGFGSSWLADVVDDIWVFAGVAAGVDVSVETEVDTEMVLGVEVGVPEVEATIGGGLGVRMGGGRGLFITCHFTRSRVAMESSTEE